MKRKRDLFILFTLMICSVLVFAAEGVKIEEWRIPPADIFPHDPAVAPDGALWYTGMGSNSLGRLEVKAGNSARTR